MPTRLRETNQGIDSSGRPFIALAWSNIPIVQVERDGEIVRDDDNEAFRDVPNPALVAGQTVTYRVRSANGSQTSNWTDPITITVGPGNCCESQLAPGASLLRVWDTELPSLNRRFARASSCHQGDMTSWLFPT